MNDRSNIQNDEFDTRGTRTSSKSNSRPLSQILQEILKHVTEIIRSEVRLARVEVRDDVIQVMKASVFLAVGGVFAFQALGFVLLGLVYALGTRAPLWLSAVIVGAAAGVTGVVLIWVGRTKIKQSNLKPDKTIRTLQENVTWLKKQTR